MSDQPTPSTDLRSFLAKAKEAFPFACEVSLAPLIAFWERGAQEDSARGALARAIQDQIRQVPALARPTIDPAELAPHGELLKGLMTAIFPPASWEQDYGVAMFPFYLKPFFDTPSFRRTLVGPDGLPLGRINLDPQTLAK